MKKKRVNIYCVICGKQIEIRPCELTKIKTCSRVCVNKYSSIRQIGRKHTPETLKKLSNAGKIHNKGERNPMYGKVHPNKGKKIHTEEFRERLSKIKKQSQLGVKNPNWKGGILPLSLNIRDLEEYKEWRLAVFAKDKYICQECGERRTIEAHHIRKFREIFAEFLKEYDQFSPIEDRDTLLRLAIKWKPFWNIDNGQTLCKHCHSSLPKIHR